MGKSRMVIYATVVLSVALASGRFGVSLGRQYEMNSLCCRIPKYRNIVLSVKETLGLVSYPSQIGQDKWVSETIFPGVKDGYFVDVGSGNGFVDSNTFALERKGWSGICIDPFPSNMEGRKCAVFKEVVYGETGKQVRFHTAGNIGGVADNLGTMWQDVVKKAPVVEFTTVTLADILDRANAPQFIHFVSLDIEGAELEALRGLPFDRYRIGAFAIEHNWEGSKRDEIHTLLMSRGYRRIHTWYQDDFYIRLDYRVPR